MHFKTVSAFVPSTSKKYLKLCCMAKDHRSIVCRMVTFYSGWYWYTDVVFALSLVYTIFLSQSFRMILLAI